MIEIKKKTNASFKNIPVFLKITSFFYVNKDYPIDLLSCRLLLSFQFHQHDKSRTLNRKHFAIYIRI